MMPNLRSLAFFLILLTVLMAACGGPNSVMDGNPNTEDEPAALEATPTPAPTTLVVCLGNAPNTLFPYGQPNRPAREILQALYDGPVDNRNYAFQPVLLESLPSIAEGTAAMGAVQVQTGDLVVDNQGNVVELKPGVFIRPAGCTNRECELAFDGSPLEMDQITAQFVMREGVQWSDGTPVTVEDSVFGFILNADPATPANKYKTDRTLSYDVVDANTLRWTGLPGFIDPEYQDNFWPPAPRHLWESKAVPELLQAGLSGEDLTGYGPFVLVDSTPERYSLQRNPNYFRAAEGLPRVDQLVFRVVGTDVDTNLAMLQTGECDLLDPAASGASQGRDAEIVSLAESGTLAASWANDGGWALLNFGIVPQSYDNDYSVWAGDRPDFFGNVEVRRAIAMCLDKEALSIQLTAGTAAVMDSFLPPDHALFNPEVPTDSLDLESADDLLTAAGWVLNSEGLRAASQIEGINNGTVFSFELLYPDLPSDGDLMDLISEQLAVCGIDAVPTPVDWETFTATGEDAPLFGRNFDLAYLRWQTVQQPPCQLYLSEQIPGPDEAAFPLKWGGANASGWQDEEYDIACRQARASVPGMEAYAANQAGVQAILAEQLPVIPLFQLQHAALARPDICGLDLDPTAGMLWNIEEIAYGEGCP